jgi:hypothetical protein
MATTLGESGMAGVSDFIQMGESRFCTELIARKQ